MLKPLSLIALALFPLAFVASGLPAAEVGTSKSFHGPVGLVSPYSLRELRKEQGLAAALDKTRSFGFRYVEVGPADFGGLAPAAFKAELDRRGLVLVGLHFNYDQIRDDVEGVAALAKALNVPRVGCAWIPHKDPFDEQQCRAAAKVFNRAGAALAKHGLQLYYHTHGYEFRPLGRGTVFDLLVTETSPKTLMFEMDVAWVVLPGQDPAELIKKYPDRWLLMHVKDFKKGVPHNHLVQAKLTDQVPVGSGQVDWPRLLRAAQEAGVKYYLIEDESPNVLQQIPQSLRYLESVNFEPIVLSGQTTNAPSTEPGKASKPLNWTTEQDHRNMMEQLGIVRLRPGPSGQPGTANSANYDPAKANPFPDLPDLLTLKNGQKVATAQMWWKQRRPEIVEDLQREVIGRVPKNVPRVTWTVVSTISDGLVGNLRANGKRLVGHVDNSAFPAITVDIRMTVVTPAKASGRVPLLVMFGGFGGDGMPRPAGTPPPTSRFPVFGGPFKDPPSTEQLLAAGWGYAIIDPRSIQADNGAGLTKGVIGLVNHGQPRKPDDWGSLRAWAWGAAAALITWKPTPPWMQRRLASKVCRGLAKPLSSPWPLNRVSLRPWLGHRAREAPSCTVATSGEAVENLTGSGEYHWMAGNFLEVRRCGINLRQQECRRPASGRPHVDRLVCAPVHLHQLRRPRTRGPQLGGPAGQLHGHRCRRARLPLARSAAIPEKRTITEPPGCRR